MSIKTWLSFLFAGAQQPNEEWNNKPTDRAFYALCRIVEEVQRDLKIQHPGILLSDIAREAKMSERTTSSALHDLEIGVPTTHGSWGRKPCVHRSGDRWYLGTGNFQGVKK